MSMTRKIAFFGTYFGESQRDKRTDGQTDEQVSVGVASWRSLFH